MSLAPVQHAPAPLDRYRLLQDFLQVRGLSARLCAPLQTEDYIVQTMPDISPTKWHLAHTSWFFETFLLQAHLKGYREFHPRYNYMFNSYYNSVGDRHCRPRRGILSRPTVAEVYQYRDHVDQHLEALLETLTDEKLHDLLPVLELGIHHEQQHQELILTDVKHVLTANPLYPAYREDAAPPAKAPAPRLRWEAFPGGIFPIGHEGDGFHFDNEAPRHEVLLRDYQLASRLTTNREYLEFMEQGGYRDPLLWLSDGWTAKESGRWEAPLYWEEIDGQWHELTLGGLRPLDLDQPVTHISYYEADAFARWAGARLPLEGEWEAACGQRSAEGNFVDAENFHPREATEGPGLRQIMGDCWEWTSSPYHAYPGFKAGPGALGEYNGKFMCNQFVLRGGSCATSATHIRTTYRNFFHPDARWQFSGIRLAKDAEQ